MAFVAISIGVVGMFLYVSNSLINDLSTQERERMQIWADANKEIIKGTQAVNYAEADSLGNFPEADVTFPFSIVQSNRNIPVLLVDDLGNILDYRNFDLPEPLDDELNHIDLSEANLQYLQKRLDDMRDSPRVIAIEVEPGVEWNIYYDDSKLLKQLSLYPYIQLAVMLAFIIIVYFAVTSTKKAEQNKVWVGLSKETAHQLGTPISSLMAWVEYLETCDGAIEPEVVGEISKDVNRLSTIASRFSKIGSKPQIQPTDVDTVVSRAVDYMATRISCHIKLTFTPTSDEAPVARLSEPLFQWVMENLIKNAVDAMEGRGAIDVTTGIDHKHSTIFIEVADTGKGLSRKQFKTIFNPGYTTKSRGWGLGLTLAKRIINQYHDGRIFVKQSEPGVGTTFRIELPLSAPEKQPGK